MNHVHILAERFPLKKCGAHTVSENILSHSSCGMSTCLKDTATGSLCLTAKRPSVSQQFNREIIELQHEYFLSRHTTMSVTTLHQHYCDIVSTPCVYWAMTWTCSDDSDALDPWLSTEHPVKTLTRLCRCAV